MKTHVVGSGLVALGLAGLGMGCATSGPAGTGSAEWVGLFNGDDLSDWVNVDCAPSTFTVRDGMVVTPAAIIYGGYLRSRPKAAA